MNYLRLSKGRRKPTGQEIAATLATTQVFGGIMNNIKIAGLSGNQNSAQKLSEASSAKNLKPRSKIFTKYGPDAFIDEMQKSFNLYNNISGQQKVALHQQN